MFRRGERKVIWNRQIEKEEHVRVPDVGICRRHSVVGEMLILNVGDAGMAVDKKTGKTVWQSANKEAGYTTPLPVSAAAKRKFGSRMRTAYVAVDPENGKEIWRMKWLTQYGVKRPIRFPWATMFLFPPATAKALRFSSRRPKPRRSDLEEQSSPHATQSGACSVGKYIYGVDGDTIDKAPLEVHRDRDRAEKWASRFGTGGLIVAEEQIHRASGARRIDGRAGFAGRIQADCARAGSRRQILDRPGSGEWIGLLPKFARRYRRGRSPQEITMKRRDFLKSTAPVFLAQRSLHSRPENPREIPHRADRLAVGGAKIF